MFVASIDNYPKEKYYIWKKSPLPDFNTREQQNKIDFEKLVHYQNCFVIMNVEELGGVNFASKDDGLTHYICKSSTKDSCKFMDWRTIGLPYYECFKLGYGRGSYFWVEDFEKKPEYFVFPKNYLKIRKEFKKL